MDLLSLVNFFMKNVGAIVIIILVGFGLYKFYEWRMKRKARLIKEQEIKLGS